MQLFISKSASGCDKDIFVNLDKVQVADVLDRKETMSAWHFDERHFRSVPNLCALIDKKLELKQSSKTIDWWHKYTNSPRLDILVGKQKFFNDLKNSIELTKSIIANADDYALRSFQTQNQLIDLLQNSFVDVEEAKRLGISEQIGELADAKLAMCKVPNYDNWSSSTGRMSILDGPKVLTMHKQNRHVFKSSFGQDGVLMGIDFKALEPRVLFTITGNDASVPDLYSHIAINAGVHDIERDTIKVMILSIL